jgi:hypothetical protein
MASTFPTLSQIQKLPDPIPSWLWSCDIELPGDKIIPGPYILEITFPFSYIEPISRYRAGSFLYFPGHSNIDTVTVNFYETEDFRVLQAFKLWQSMVIDDLGNYSAPTSFLGAINLHLHDNQGRERATCHLYGCWPARLTDWSLNYQSSTHLQVGVQFSVNNSKFVFKDINDSQVLGFIGFDRPAMPAPALPAPPVP